MQKEGEKMNRFDEIRLELRAFGLKQKPHKAYETTFTKIAELSKAEEGCTIYKAREAVAVWWDNSTGQPTDVFFNCLAAMPLAALKKEYLQDNKRRKAK